MKIIRCAFCKGSGSVAGWGGPDPCPVCHGRCEVHITYDNPKKCGFCKGSGSVAGWGGAKPCHLCKGIGVICPVLFD